MTIRVFIGCSANNEDLEFQSVLEYSIRKHHASDDLEINWMKLSRDPKSFWFSDSKKGLGWVTKGWATPFSALRWGIPAACNYEGKAIYLDVDMILRADIADLWNQEIKAGKAMLSKPEGICVAMYDNAAMKAVLPHIDQIKRTGIYRDLRRRMSNPAIVQRYTGNWNCLDLRKDNSGGEYQDINDPEIKLLHYTWIPTQPHLRYAVPRLRKEGGKHWYDGRNGPMAFHKRPDAMKLFDDLLKEATEAGYGIERYRSKEMFGEYGR